MKRGTFRTVKPLKGDDGTKSQKVGFVARNEPAWGGEDGAEFFKKRKNQGNTGGSFWGGKPFAVGAHRRQGPGVLKRRGVPTKLVPFGWGLDRKKNGQKKKKESIIKKTNC